MKAARLSFFGVAVMATWAGVWMLDDPDRAWRAVAAVMFVGAGLLVGIALAAPEERP